MHSIDNLNGGSYWTIYVMRCIIELIMWTVWSWPNCFLCADCMTIGLLSVDVNLGHTTCGYINFSKLFQRIFLLSAIMYTYLLQKMPLLASSIIYLWWHKLHLGKTFAKAQPSKGMELAEVTSDSYLWEIYLWSQIFGT
jgi:hypothetical protein